MELKRFIPFTFVIAALAIFVGVMYEAWPPVHADGPSNFSYLAIAGSTSATSVKDGPGIFHTLTVNTAGASSVITIFDLSKANCTSTPSTNKIGTITLPASGALPGSLLYDLHFANGLCIQDGTAASDKTVTYN